MFNKLFTRNLPKFIIILVCIFALNAVADAQRRKSRTKNASPKATAAVNNAVIKEGANKVGIQLKNLTKSIFLLGSIAQGIEDIDKQVRAGKASRELKAQNEQNKADVVASIRSLRAGLVAMEIDFRVKPELKPYLPQIEGIIDMSAQAEDLALAGRFTDTGKQFLLIVEKLTDALVEMP